MQPDKFKNQIRNIVLQQQKVEFLGADFDNIVNMLTESKATKIIGWLQKILSENIAPIILAKGKTYKEWKTYQLIVFRYPFRISNNEYGILFVKVKNSFYIEFHLGNHKYD